LVSFAVRNSTTYQTGTVFILVFHKHNTQIIKKKNKKPNQNKKKPGTYKAKFLSCNIITADVIQIRWGFKVIKKTHSRSPLSFFSVKSRGKIISPATIRFTFLCISSRKLDGLYSPLGPVKPSRLYTQGLHLLSVLWD